MAVKSWEPEKLRKKHVIQAAKIWDEKGYRNFKKSISYDVIINGREYPPKAISSCAHELATGRSLSTSEFGGAKDGTWHKRLKSLGFSIIEKRPQIDFHTEVVAASKLDPTKRAKLLAELPKAKPERISAQVYRFYRSALVVAERLYLANGRCEECRKLAPFKRSKDGTPYLEVHHIKPLSRGGFDVVSNTMAVCPNCHCQIHDRLGLDPSSD